MFESEIRCPNCGYEGQAETETKGAFCLEIVLWCLLLIPGIIYTVWRMTAGRVSVCPQCGFENVVKK